MVADQNGENGKFPSQNWKIIFKMTIFTKQKKRKGQKYFQFSNLPTHNGALDLP